MDLFLKLVALSVKVEYDKEWANGTGYLNFVDIPGYKCASFEDDAGRMCVWIPQIQTVIFQRYSQRPEIFVSNTKKGKMFPTALSMQEMEMAILVAKGEKLGVETVARLYCDYNNDRAKDVIIGMTSNYSFLLQGLITKEADIFLKYLSSLTDFAVEKDEFKLIVSRCKNASEDVLQLL